MPEKPVYSKELFYRDMDLEIRKEDESGIEISISSDQVVERWFGEEVLSHAPGAANLDRAHALLFHHDPTRIIGPLSDKRLEGGRSYARAKFDDTPEGDLARKRVASKSLRGTSAGYVIKKLRKLDPGEEFDLGDGRKITGSKREDYPTYVAVRWELLEASLTPIPADATTGVGRAAIRSLDGIEIEESNHQRTLPLEAGDEEPGGTESMEERDFTKELEDELKRRDEEHQAQIKDVFERAATIGQEALAFRLLSEGKPAREITDELFKAVAKERGAPGGPTGDRDEEVEEATIDNAALLRAFTNPLEVVYD